MQRHLLVVAVLLTGLAVPASAAPTRCPQLSDPVGDHDQVLGDAASDLTQVRVSGDGRSVTVVARLADLATTTPAPTGHVYQVYLDNGETGRVLTAAVDGLAPSFRAAAGRAPRGGGVYPSGGDLGAVKGVVDVSRSEVRMTATLAQLRLTPGTRFEASAVVWRSVGTPEAGPVARDSIISSTDFSDTTAPYRLGDRGCR
jgi:hypothetical protein